jgi:hypothetical protein
MMGLPASNERGRTYTAARPSPFIAFWSMTLLPMQSGQSTRIDLIQRNASATLSCAQILLMDDIGPSRIFPARFAHLQFNRTLSISEGSEAFFLREDA